MTRTIIILMAMIISMPVSAIDKCNPYVKKNVRDTLVCEITERQQQLEKETGIGWSKVTRQLLKGEVQRRQLLLDAVDAQAISEADAKSMLQEIKEVDNGNYEYVADEINRRPPPQQDTPSIDITCRKQFDDSVRCR